MKKKTFFQGLAIGSLASILAGCTLSNPVTKPEVAVPVISIEELEPLRDAGLDVKPGTEETEPVSEDFCDEIEYEDGQLKAGLYYGIISGKRVIFRVSNYRANYGLCMFRSADSEGHYFSFFDTDCDKKYDYIEGFNGIYRHSEDKNKENFFSFEEEIKINKLLELGQKLVCEKNLIENNKDFARKDLEYMLKSFEDLLE